ncbi:sigma-70 family RNA polymerase sigma factor, partial [Streptomyces drozdowiczii]|nr:sigma-70 family RNA polymerase sigma factor [Streptomyces drozdowiczii]
PEHAPVPPQAPPAPTGRRRARHGDTGPQEAQPAPFALPAQAAPPVRTAPPAETAPPAPDGPV